MVSVGISSLGCNKLIFIDPVVKITGSYYWLTTRSGAFCKSECMVKSTIWKKDWFINGATLISLSLTEQLASGDSVCVAVSVKNGQFEHQIKALTL